MAQPITSPIISKLSQFLSDRHCLFLHLSLSLFLSWHPKTSKRTSIYLSIALHYWALLLTTENNTKRGRVVVSMATTIPTPAFIATPHRSAGRSSAICVQRAQFCGFSSSPSPSFGVSLIGKKPSLRLVSFKAVRCEVKEARTPLIPTEQRWMFEESEINGPVTSFSSISVLNCWELFENFPNLWTFST